MSSRANTDEVQALRGFPARILIVEDALTSREMLSRLLRARGFRVSVVGADGAPRAIGAEAPDAVLVNLVGRSGLDMVPACRTADADIPLLVVSDIDPEPHEAAAAGDRTTVIIRPFQERQVEEALARALGPLIRPDILAVRRAAPHPAAALLGESRVLAEVRRLIERVAVSDVTVLVCGESGTGKEVTARALRLGSRRADRPFVKVNCAALPHDLLESELFGHERGAFTGAMHAKPGKFEVADRGSIFLDEIGEMSALLQAKLLQVLQDGEFSRLGSATDTRVDIRVIAATNRDLKRAVALGQFREDLYFRLNVVCIALPPLREHKEDIPLLTDHFLRQYADLGIDAPPLGSETRQLFLDYDWPGNVRELENLVKRIIVLGSDASVRHELAAAVRERAQAPQVMTLPTAAAPGGVGGAGELPGVRANGTAAPPPLPATTSLKDIGRTAAREAERAAILAMLERTRWNRKEAAEILGISYKALLYKIKDNHLDDAP